MNIQEINIEIINMTSTYININCQKNIVNLYGKEKRIDSEKIYELLSIIRTWQPFYNNSNNIDSESYKIEIIDKNNNKEILTGKGNYPSNYSLFKEWIRGL